MTDEEKKSLRNLENLSEFGLSTSLNQADLDKMKIVLNLVEKQDKVIDRLSNLVIIKSLKPNGEHTNCTYDFDYSCKLNEEGYRKYSCKDCVKEYYFKEVMKDE